MRPELVAKNFSSSVAGSSATYPTCPDTYQPPTMTRPMTMPPTIISGDARNSRSLSTNTASAAASTNGSASLAAAGAPHAANNAGRSDVAAPHPATSKRQGSSALTRHTAKRPFSVMYAEMPSTTITITDFRLPAPARISVLLPQPEASVIPKPNRKPPTRQESQRTCGAV